MAQLTRAFRDVALRIQEAAQKLSQSNIYSRLNAALEDVREESGGYAYIVDVFGDESGGKLVYSCGGDLYMAAYTMTSDGTTTSCVIDHANAMEVQPRITYETDTDAGEMTEADRAKVGGLALKESSCQFADAIDVREAKSDYEVKLIAPGKGSTAFYPAEALKASGPKTFRAGTHMYWNHPSASEEADRPERDLNHLAAVLTSDARWVESAPQGAGLYARAKVFGDYAEKVADKAAHIGLSIMASGTAEMRDGKPVMREGVPVLKEFTHAQSTDFVTRAGAGGMVLTESAARSQDTTELQEGATNMDASELKKLQEGVASLEASNRKLRERLAVSDAAREVGSLLADMRVSETIGQRVSKRILSGAIPLTEGGDLDSQKLKALVESETKEECAYIEKVSGGRIVTGMGSDPVQISEADRAAQQKRIDAEADAFAAGLGFQTKEARDIMTHGRAAFKPTFRATGEAIND